MRAVNTRNYPTVEAAARAQDAGAARARYASPEGEVASLASALRTVLDLAYLTTDRTETEDSALRRLERLWDSFGH